MSDDQYYYHHKYHSIWIRTSGWLAVRNLLAIAFFEENKRDKSSRPQTHTFKQQVTFVSGGKTIDSGLQATKPKASLEDCLSKYTSSWNQPHSSRRSNSNVVVQEGPVPPPPLWTAAGETLAQAPGSAQLTTWKPPCKWLSKISSLILAQGPLFSNWHDWQSENSNIDRF